MLFGDRSGMDEEGRVEALILFLFVYYFHNNNNIDMENGEVWTRRSAKTFRFNLFFSTSEIPLTPQDSLSPE